MCMLIPHDKFQFMVFICVGIFCLGITLGCGIIALYTQATYCYVVANLYVNTAPLSVHV